MKTKYKYKYKYTPTTITTHTDTQLFKWLKFIDCFVCVCVCASVFSFQKHFAVSNSCLKRKKIQFVVVDSIYVCLVSFEDVT